MAIDERELELRRRLGAYIDRQSVRVTRLEKLASSLRPQHGELPSANPGAPTSSTEAAELPSRGNGVPTVTVIVPVYNAGEELAVCLWSLARNTTYPADLLLVDDASTEPQVDELLEWAQGLDGVRVLRNAQNLGFPTTVNRALRACTGDVVLLNSDTAVGPRWLERLVQAAYSEPTVGTVTPLSDNAGAFSAPEVGVRNVLPAHLGFDDVARLVAAEAEGLRPRAPTGNGFCLYIRRALIAAVGEMNANEFKRGYGEENDFCMRAGRRGWSHVVDDATFVHHEREASFGAAKKALAAAARRRLDVLHPDYTEQVRAFASDAGMARARERVAGALARGAREGRARLRLLFVIHEGGGGVPATNRDLMSALRDEFECFCLSSDRQTLQLCRIDGSSSETLREWPLELPILLGDFSREDYRSAFADTLARCQPDLVHIRHLYKHTFDAPRLAAEQALPVVMSFHDHYFICPTIHLLDDHGRYCAGKCTPGNGQCPTVRAGSLPILKHSFVHQWREEAESALGGVDAFVTTSEYTRDMHRRFLPVARRRPFEVIEHGRDLSQQGGLAIAPVPGGPVKIVVPGHLDRHKGAELLSAMCVLDRGRRLELHFLGDVPERYRQLGVCHGAYERDHLAARLTEIKPSFVGVFSVTGESYSHAVTEAWAAGVPVLATDLGAQAERVRAHGGGFLVAHDDPAVALEQVYQAADDAGAYEREAERASAEDLPNVREMAASYADLYRDVLDRRRSLAHPNSALSSPLRRGVWHMSAILPSTFTADGREARRLLHPGIAWKLRTRIDAGGSVVNETDDVVLVEQDALNAAQARRLVTAVRGRPLVLNCSETPNSLPEVLLAAAKLVIVPTRELASSYLRVHPRVAVLPPLLDERLFLRDTDGGPPASAVPRAGEPVRLVYTSTRIATQELTFLAEVLEHLSLRGTATFELEIVSSESPPALGARCRHVEAPDPERDYPGYARLLRSRAPDWHVALAPQLAGVRAGTDEARRLEYAALGLPTVCSPGAERKANGRARAHLVSGNSVDAWRDSVQRLGTDAELRARLRAESWADLIGSRLLRHGARALLEAIGEAIGEAPRVPASGSPPLTDDVGAAGSASRSGRPPGGVGVEPTESRSGVS